ncbi:Sperm-associated antigen 6 [Folsomia candida]|uniref:Sperm-associated antigen 6 n=1 Tax=Folsomia candida TaxID=158441 RepID=A0A226E0V9_FOLCA|nr:Sperm-associated antigen 6 [Folsomia candida]
MSHKGEMKSWAKYLRYYKFLGFSARGEIPTVWTSGGLRKIQELLTPDCPDILREHIQLINSCFPPDIVNYFSPDYPQTLLDRIDQYAPTLNIDPSLWTEKLFSDTKIPTDVKEEIVALQKSVYVKNKEQQQPAQAISGANDQDGGAGGRRRSNKSGTAINMGGDAKPPLPM